MPPQPYNSSSARLNTASFSRILPLLLIALLLTLLSPAGRAADSLLAAPHSNSPSLLPSSPLPSSSDTLVSPNQSLSQRFLPVYEAYQLNANRQGNNLQLHWDIADGYYLYRHNLSVLFNGIVLTADLPEGQRIYDDYFEKELQVFYHSLELALPLPAAALEQINQGETLDLEVRSQGCADAGLCYPPQQQTVQLGPDQARVLAPLQPSPGATPPGSVQASQSPLSLTGFMLAAVGALLGGMLLNLMPCVFPVLSLKALSLVNSHERPRQQHYHGWAYTLGAVTTFVAIAAIMLSLRQAGQAVGWGFQLQSPAVVASLAYLFFVMGLTLSGGLQLSGSLAGAGQKLTQGGGYRASFFTGALATVVASPCTAPFMGSALGYAVTQPAAVALSVFACLGLGMALPFLLLSYFPSLTKRLPKPGAWMETLKQLLAFPLYLTALWLLWVVGRQTDSDTVIALLAGAAGLAFAGWLWQHQPARPWQKGLAVLTALLMLWPPLGLNSRTGGNAAAQLSPTLEHQWQPFSHARLQQLLDSGTPTFVNLTADWCITCLANEKIALDTENTISAFEQAGIVKLKGDWTHYNPEITRLLAEFGRNGVPLYLLYSGKENEPPVILPQILREQTVTNAIQKLNPSS